MATPKAPLREVGDAPRVTEGKRAGWFRTGTEVKFLPSKETFTKTVFDYATLEHRLRELAFLNSGVFLNLSDARHADAKSPSICTTRAASKPSSNISTAPNRRCTARSVSMMAEKDGIIGELAMEWNDSYHENTLCFTNNIPQRDGGTHLAGFRAALTRTLNRATRANTASAQEG